MTAPNDVHSLHALRQPIAAIMNFAAAGSRMAENGADHRALKKVFAQVYEQAERLGEICNGQENARAESGTGKDL